MRSDSAIFAFITAKLALLSESLWTSCRLNATSLVRGVTSRWRSLRAFAPRPPRAQCNQLPTNAASSALARMEMALRRGLQQGTLTRGPWRAARRGASGRGLRYDHSPSGRFSIWVIEAINKAVESQCSTSTRRLSDSFEPSKNTIYCHLKSLALTYASPLRRVITPPSARRPPPAPPAPSAPRVFILALMQIKLHSNSPTWPRRLSTRSILWCAG
ncbi:hypothetical protein EVAR_43782_1 [Eumeta japonica]|uniref:Uncharacterized protein n=1 Tax=Eumeta variegata TaxID=151549 RepID=A0A4C1XTQ4_EUMVA|nr:hypothetical protein EVAR_43782_1 [Eumeta japonica]